LKTGRFQVATAGSVQCVNQQPEAHAPPEQALAQRFHSFGLDPIDTLCDIDNFYAWNAFTFVGEYAEAQRINARAAHWTDVAALKSAIRH